MSYMSCNLEQAPVRTHLRGVATGALEFPRKSTVLELGYESQVSIVPGLATMESNERVRKQLGLEPESGVWTFRCVLAYLDELQEPSSSY